MATFKDHFSSHAALYARARPGYPDNLGALLADLSPATEAVWDCGCGTGQLSTMLATRFSRVDATDASAEQIASAKPHPGVTYRTARAEASGLEENGYDLIVAAQAAHWFDIDRFYSEARRVGRPGAAIVLVGYGKPRLEGPLGEWLDRFHDELLRDDWPPERWLLVDGYRDLPFPFAELEVEPLATTLDWTLDELLAYIETWSALRVAERGGRRARINACLEEFGMMWGDPADRREIRWPIRLRAGHLPKGR